MLHLCPPCVGTELLMGQN